MDECAAVGICSQTCINRLGSYKCDCIDGYQKVREQQSIICNLYCTIAILRSITYHGIILFKIARIFYEWSKISFKIPRILFTILKQLFNEPKILFKGPSKWAVQGSWGSTKSDICAQDRHEEAWSWQVSCDKSVWWIIIWFHWSCKRNIVN